VRYDDCISQATSMRKYNQQVSGHTNECNILFIINTTIILIIIFILINGFAGAFKFTASQ